MKLPTFIFFLMIASPSFAQEEAIQSFQLSDTIFEIGQSCQLSIDTIFVKDTD